MLQFTLTQEGPLKKTNRHFRQVNRRIHDPKTHVLLWAFTKSLHQDRRGPALVPVDAISYIVVYPTVWYTLSLRRLPEGSCNWRGPASDHVLRQIQDDLAQNPARGDAVKGLGGIRKARAANPVRGKGKRGGYRYLFIYLAHKGHIHLLYLLDKDEQADLDEEQRKVLRNMVAELKKS